MRSWGGTREGQGRGQRQSPLSDAKRPKHLAGENVGYGRAGLEEGTFAGRVGFQCVLQGAYTAPGAGRGGAREGDGLNRALRGK